MKLKLSLCLILLFSFALSIDAQKLDYRQGQVLVELEKGDSALSTVRVLEANYGSDADFKASQVISEPMNVWKITFDFARINELEVLQLTKDITSIYNAQLNHIIELRNTPDDPLYADQWQYVNVGQNGGLENADLDLDEAWDITTGGLTVDGDSIVVCIIDDGLDPSHDDFGNNKWINHNEIPGNNIDDDANGYVDDYRGWDTYENTDDIYQGGKHGTSVTGIVGAKGNNGIGVAGVNWDVKLMIVRGGGDEANALASYAYPYAMRKLYNESNGNEGAFVVSTNASWGSNYGQPDDAPLWCNFYDSLGMVGIINCGATANLNINVDIEGDLPTACSSDFLISVSNINRSGNKDFSAGYGVNSIDLGAFGEEVYTTSIGNSYTGFGGTSGATPHVAGAAALIYSMPHPELIALSKSNPAEAALLVKDIILNSVKKDEQFVDEFLTSGVLNVKNALGLVGNIFSDCPFPLVIETENLNLDSTQITWEANSDVNNYNLRLKLESDSIWTEILDVTSPYVLGELSECGMYEVQLQSICEMDSMSSYSFSKQFSTLGCCNAPANLSYSNDPEVLAENSISLAWDEDKDHQNYMVLYKSSSSTSWDTINTENNSLIIEDLRFCSAYEVQISSLCITGIETPLSDTLLAVTSCGRCTTLDYCPTPEVANSGEWIDSILIDGQLAKTGPDQGYMNFSGFYDIDIRIGAEIPLIIGKGFDDVLYNEWIKVWVDLDNDGIFTDDEMVFDEGEATSESINTFITINGEFVPGFTLMRVGMLFEGEPTACGDPESLDIYGEYEDYCVNLIGPCDYGLEIENVQVGETEATVTFTMVDTSIAYNVRYKKVEESDEEWETISVIDTVAQLSDLEACTDYVVQVRAVCDIDTSGYMAVEEIFKTTGSACMVGIEDVDEASFSINAFPNPFVNHLNLKVQSEINGKVNIEVVNINGQLISKSIEFLRQGENSISLNESISWAPGIYLIKVISDEFQKSSKVIKISN